MTVGGKGVEQENYYTILSSFTYIEIFHNNLQK